MWMTRAAKWRLVPRLRFAQEGPFFSYDPMGEVSLNLLRFLLRDKDQYIDERFLRDVLVPRLQRKHPLSLRLLDWLVVDYAKDKGVGYERFVPFLGRTLLIVVHHQYLVWLAQWRRRNLDAFRRKERIYFQLDGWTFATTVAQLHFFYIAHQFGFLAYAEENLADITAHMKATMAAGAHVPLDPDDDDATADGAAAMSAKRRSFVSNPATPAFVTDLGPDGISWKYCPDDDNDDDDGDEDDDDDDDVDRNDEDDKEQPGLKAYLPLASVWDGTSAGMKNLWRNLLESGVPLACGSPTPTVVSSVRGEMYGQ